MDAADYRIDYLGCAHGTRNDLVYGHLSNRASLEGGA